MRIIGYAYEADLHCPRCTFQRFPQLESDVNAVAVDNEGNDVTPVYRYEFSSDPCCGDCFCEL